MALVALFTPVHIMCCSKNELNELHRYRQMSVVASCDGTRIS
jgi:hypothetical protein